MDFTIPEHYKTGVLNGDDLIFFYYDIGLDNLQGLPASYDWDEVIAEFDGLIDIDACKTSEIPKDYIQNNIRFTVSKSKKYDNGSKSAAFFRHLRNAFAHYHIVREEDNYVLTDERAKVTMRGLINVELLKKFCFRFFDIREKIIADYENSINPTI